MADVDQWLARVARNRPDPAPATFAAIERRLAAEPAPQAFARRSEARRAMLCAGIAAVFGFAAVGSSTYALAKSRPAWLATPSTVSPYSLLVGR